MFCDKCGAENRDEAEFCVKCGNRLSGIRTSAGEDGTVPSSGQSELDYVEKFKLAVSGRYEVIRELGRGGMAIVFLAKDKRLDRNVALKLLPQEISMDRNFTERFMREARISAKLSHPNIIQIHDVDKIDEFTFYSMSYIDGVSLAQIIRKKGALSPKIVMRLGIQICFALQHAHEKGVIHRDIKPENILIDRKRMPIVVDFGIARAMSDSRLSSTGMFIGTPQYMSPEQIKSGDVDARSDIYSLGGMLYEMAVGRPAFVERDTAALMYKHVHERPKPPHEVNGNVPKALSDIIMKALAKNPKDRPQSARELAKMLHEVSLTLQAPEKTPSRAAAAERAEERQDADGFSEELEKGLEKERREQDEGTVVMRRPAKPEEAVSEEAEGSGGDTIAMKKPVGKPRKSAKKKKKKGVPAFMVGLVIFGLLGMAALGLLSLLKTSPRVVRRPVGERVPVSRKSGEPAGGGEKAQPPAPGPGEEEKKAVKPGKEVSGKRETPVAERPKPREPAKQPASVDATAKPPAESRRVPSEPEKPAGSSSPGAERRSGRETTPVTERPQPAAERSGQKVPEPAGEPQIATRVVPETRPPEKVERKKPPAETRKVAIRWVKIPGGTFEMGDFIGDLRKELMCRPVHRVTVSSFEMSQTEVTVEQYAVFLRNTGHSEPPEWKTQTATPDRPVVFVSWYDAAAFAKWAGARLPTEAEWEYAARGGLSRQMYPWGSEPPQGRANLGKPWENGNGWKKYLMKPGMFPPNGFGLFDMAGNVWEWTADRFGPYQSGLAVNPTGSRTGNLRVMRGGAWNSTESFVRNAIRGPSDPNVKKPHIGFRIARSSR